MCFILSEFLYIFFTRSQAVGSLWEVLCKYLARNLAGFVPHTSQVKRLIKSALNWRDMCVCVASSGLGSWGGLLQPPLATTPLCIAHTYVLPLLQLISITCPFSRLTRSTLLLNNSACLWRYFPATGVCVCVCVCGHLGKRQLPVHTHTHWNAHTRLWLVSALWLSVAYFMHPSTPFGTFLGYWLC